ncbi:methyltransferase TYW3-domain-containing protein [Xylogone sp. PMI_703]|nr:methyltransferase TYW3-domain-containing protein [Xylogone sp. PMI_703]
MPQHSPTTPFHLKKSTILANLSVPASSYDDLSPKGSIDAGIRTFIDEINAIEGLVTTSSCSGRVAVFLEGERKKRVDEGGSKDEEEVEEEEESRTKAGVGGKGGGGKWLFVSHDAVDLSACESESEGGIVGVFGMVKGEDARVLMNERMDTRFIHFKFEPFILHILTDSLTSAQNVLKAALQAGFRESGAINLTSPSPSSSSGPAAINPIVAVRSMGLSLESIIGFHHEDRDICMVPEWQLRNLVEISNQRFVENEKRIERFRELLIRGTGKHAEGRKKGEGEGVWEDAAVRRERMRVEGLRRREVLKEQEKNGSQLENDEIIEDIGLGFVEDNS